MWKEHNLLIFFLRNFKSSKKIPQVDSDCFNLIQLFSFLGLFLSSFSQKYSIYGLLVKQFKEELTTLMHSSLAKVLAVFVSVVSYQVLLGNGITTSINIVSNLCFHSGCLCAQFIYGFTIFSSVHFCCCCFNLSQLSFYVSLLVLSRLIKKLYFSQYFSL